MVLVFGFSFPFSASFQGKVVLVSAIQSGFSFGFQFLLKRRGWGIFCLHWHIYANARFGGGFGVPQLSRPWDFVGDLLERKEKWALGPGKHLARNEPQGFFEGFLRWGPLVGNENSAQSFSDRSFWKPLRVVDVRAFGPWMSAPKCLFFQDFDRPDRSFGPGYPRGWPPDVRGISVPKTSSLGWFFVLESWLRSPRPCQV